jgi:hypothetical protein
VLDAVRPTFFAPIRDSVRLEMKDTGMRFRALFPGDAATPSIWRFWLGFNVSHGLGVLAFGSICLLIGAQDFDLVGQVDGLRALTIAIPAAYLANSLVFWFYAIDLLIVGSITCFIVSAVVA